MERVPLSGVEPAEAVDGVHLSQLAAGTEMSVQHFRIDPGARVPEHSHPHEQTGYVTAGELTFLVDGEEVTVSAGDSYAIPGDEPHGAENRGDEPVEGVDIFAPPRVNPDWDGADES
ncbi:cupin domain-containing protein [Salinigranum rubrum]|uniref:Cupin domain-containing protein n=1 Tax=Salinigranum rubrum TaxID=755307 RepID=A0A2I8VM02_9EURY|nr:cupin domain-containing protein [Salinigranum rubrum]AUV82951.1 cupin domain-containing protein [Salinigranum rubrum]